MPPESGRSSKSPTGSPACSNAQGERGRVVVESSALVREAPLPRRQADRALACASAAHVAGGPLTTVVVSVAGDVELAPLAVDAARAQLVVLLDAWWQGMRRPLPLAVKSALAWPNAAAGDGTTPRRAVAAAAARRVYEAGYASAGEVGNCPYLQRAYPDFAALWARRLRDRFRRGAGRR